MNIWESLRQHANEIGVTEERWSDLPETVEVVKVVGMSFISDYPQNIRSLLTLHANRKGDIIVQLVRNPGNKYDKNAIEVRLDNRMLGHLPKDVAARLAPGIDDGSVKILATVHQVRVHPDNPQNPGLDVLLDYGA